MRGRGEGRLAFAAAALALALALAPPAAAAAGAHRAPAARSAVLLVADGAGPEAYALARWVKGAPLALDAIWAGAVRTHIADSAIADSAPAATAYAAGIRTGAGIIGLGPVAVTVPGLAPPPAPLLPRASVLEAARLAGKATGLVATSTVSHATPAAFAAHVPVRADEAAIMAQLAHAGVDVVLGGGAALLTPPPVGVRADGEDLAAALRRRGAALPATAAELAAVREGRVFGLFARWALAPALDRAALRPSEPTLREMTAAALRLLSRDPDGFFLMVEGSQVDWAGHANDPVWLVSELLAFDAAVEEVLRFAARRDDVLVVALSDHGTGGLTIGSRALEDYTALSPEALAAPFREARRTAAALWASLGPAPSPAAVRAAAREDWGVDLGEAAAAEVVLRAGSLPPERAHVPLAVAASVPLRIGWTTHGHTGGDVPLFSSGPGRPTGLVDAPEIGRGLARALGLDLDAATRTLFVDPAEGLPGAEVRVREVNGTPASIAIAWRGVGARAPVNGAEVVVERSMESRPPEPVPLPGLALAVTLPDGTRRVWLPARAIALVREAAARR